MKKMFPYKIRVACLTILILAVLTGCSQAASTTTTTTAPAASTAGETTVAAATTSETTVAATPAATETSSTGAAGGAPGSQPPGGTPPGGAPSGGNPPGGTPPGGAPPGGGAASIDTGTGAYLLAGGEALNGGVYTSTKADENAIRAEGDITASLEGVTVEKTGGDASSSEASSFYGLNAAILALDNATLNITGGTVTATAEGANGVLPIMARRSISPIRRSTFRAGMPAGLKSRAGPR